MIIEHEIKNPRNKLARKYAESIASTGNKSLDTALIELRVWAFEAGFNAGFEETQRVILKRVDENETQRKTSN